MSKSLRVITGIITLMLLLAGGFGCSKASATTTSNGQTTPGTTTTVVSTSAPPTITSPGTISIHSSTTISFTTASSPPSTSMTAMPTTTTKPPSTGTPTVTGIDANTVIVSGYTFSPDTIQVPVGTKVVWINLDAADHTVTSTSPGIFDNPLPSLGTTSITFALPGRYDYICSIHPYMTGTVIVK